jgi:hypothetical protein
MLVASHERSAVAALPQQITPQQTLPQQTDWLEPHGISIIDLVGQVPEAVLRDAILVYSNNGMVQYQSGQRSGNTVTITVKLTPRYEQSGSTLNTLVNCLGQPGLTDTWPVVAPPMTMRVFENGNAITSEAWLWRFAPGGRIHPSNRPTAGFRYPEGATDPVQFADDGSLSLPATRGCAIVFRGQRSNLTATFTIPTPRYIQVEVLGSATFTFHSYVGPGGAGELEALRRQMEDRYANRHDKFTLTPPDGTEFVFVTYPPTPVHAYVGAPVELNMVQPASGSYRLARGGGAHLSVDHVAAYGLPLRYQTRDADQASSAEYLPVFSDAVMLASPEYFVPAGISYNPCMRGGGCPASLLEQIYNSEMTMTIHYLRIGRIANGLDRIPIKQTGPRWSPSLLANAVVPSTATAQRQEDDALFLPVITAVEAPPPVLPDDPTGCPCGWFDSHGRMLDYVPGQ